MRKDWKYIVYISVALVLFILVKVTSPKQFDWSVTLAHDDKDPYGTFALNELLPSFLNGYQLRNSYQTLYELKDSLNAADNVFILATRFSPGDEDVNAIMKHAYDGGRAVISSQYFDGKISDTLNVGTNDNLFDGGTPLASGDSSSLKFNAASFDTTARFWYREDNIHNYFDSFDSSRTTVIARNELEQPVTIRISVGKGYLVLNSTPLIFTNIYLLSNQNHNFVSGTLSYFSDHDIQRTEYYHLGRMESQTPLRFVLNNEPLSWAYYLTIFAILVFMIFEAKRKQRIIPVINPMANTTLQFVSTIGNLYFQNGDHKNLADKKIQFFLEHIRTKYFLPTNLLDDNFINLLSLKSATGEEEVRALFNTVNYILKVSSINVEILMDLNEKIEKFTRRS